MLCWCTHKSLEFYYILGDESLRKKPKIVYQNEDGNFQVILSKRTNNNEISITIDEQLNNKRIVKQRKPCDKKDINDIKVKTLAEIRAERNAKKDSDHTMTQQEKEEAEVTSTSEENDIPMDVSNESTENNRKIKIRRRLPSPSNETENKVHTTDYKSNNQEVSEDKLLDDIDIDDDDDEDDYDITLKAEEDLLNEVDE